MQDFQLILSIFELSRIKDGNVNSNNNGDRKVFPSTRSRAQREAGGVAVASRVRVSQNGLCIVSL